MWFLVFAAAVVSFAFFVLVATAVANDNGDIVFFPDAVSNGDIDVLC